MQQQRENFSMGSSDVSKTFFMPVGFDIACEAAEQEYRAKYGTIPKIGKAPRDVQRLQGKITSDEIRIIQKYMEKCLQLYMTQTEVVAALQQAEVDPGFTSIVWDKINESNEPFFKAYNTMLRVKEQIMAFNYLISQQAQLMQTNRLGFYGGEKQIPPTLANTPNPFAGTSLPSLASLTPIAPAIMVPRDMLPPDIDDSEDDSDEEFNEKPKSKKKKTTKKVTKPKSPKPPKTKAKRSKAGSTATPVENPSSVIMMTTPSPGTPVQLVPVTSSPGPTLLFPSPGQQRPTGNSILVVNSPNFRQRHQKPAPRQIAASGVPVVTNRGKAPTMSPIPVISAKPGAVPQTGTVNIIKAPGPPTLPVTNSGVTIIPNKPPVITTSPVNTRPQVKPPSALQMPVIRASPSVTNNSNVGTNSGLVVENSDLDTNVFLNE